MQINNLKVKNRKKRKKIVGRGGKKGTYSGRGNKGQKARSGAHIDPLFEGGRSTLIDHMKKKRGFKSGKSKALVIDIKQLEKKFKDGETVDIESLIKVGLIDKIKSTKVKILGKAILKKKLNVGKGILLSASAKESLEKAGGKVAV